MPRSVITAIVASTHPLEKYGGVQIPLETLEELLAQLKSDPVPMQMDHRVLRAIDATILGSRIEEWPDGEHALVVSFEADEDVWAEVEAGWKASGVPGGFSAALTQGQETLEGPGVAPVKLISDAGAYSDRDRIEAARLLSEVAPVEVIRLFQFSDIEFAKLVIEFGREVGATLLSGGLMYLVGRRKGQQSHIEWRREEADGTVTTAILDTEDPEMVRVAADCLDGREQSLTPLVFDLETERWVSR